MHRGTQFLSPGKLGENGEVGIVPNPKQLDKSIDYDSLFKEFNSTQDIEYDFLKDLIFKMSSHKKSTHRKK